IKLTELYSFFLESQGNESLKQIFYNSRLGLPYASAGARLSHPLLAACAGDYLPQTTSELPTAMGIDVGAKLHVEIRELTKDGWRIIYINSHKEFSELDILMSQYRIKAAVIDAMPETRKAVEFQKKHSYKVWLCRYTAQPVLHAIDTKTDDKEIKADRTQTLDASHAQYLRKEIAIPKNWNNLDNGDFGKQMCAITRIYDADADRFKWVESDTTPDHYRHADNYAYIAGTLIVKGVPVMGVI
ncbi:MAG: hypothetical protein L0Y56_16280, partial [Nitrospira sp.]|nr:hypothetical protein [Nitrospira sp.]